MCKKNESQCVFCKDGRTFGGEKEQGIILCLLFFLRPFLHLNSTCVCVCVRAVKKKEVNVSHIYAIKKLDQEEMSYSYKVETTEGWRRCLSRC